MEITFRLTINATEARQIAILRKLIEAGADVTANNNYARM